MHSVCIGLVSNEIAEMPSCNLAETVHNKWLQQLGNRGNDLYVATVDNYVSTFMQMVRYYHFLKGENPGMGPGKTELMLRVAQRYAQRTGNPKGLNEAMAIVPGGCLLHKGSTSRRRRGFWIDEKDAEPPTQL